METQNINFTTGQSNDQFVNISREKLLSLVTLGNGSDGATPNPDDPVKPGPWDPVMRRVLSRYFAPGTQSWITESRLKRLLWEILAERIPAIYDVIGGNPLSLVALNPQPLPPGSTFIVEFTEEAVDRIILMQEIADGINNRGQEQSIIIVGGKLSDLVEELCPIPFKFPFPHPGPKRHFEKGLDGLQLLRAAKVIERRAEGCSNVQLQEELMGTSRKLMEEGIGRL